MCMNLNTGANLLLQHLHHLEKGMQIESETPMVPGFRPDWDFAYHEIDLEMGLAGYDTLGVIAGVIRRTSLKCVRKKFPEFIDIREILLDNNP